MAQLFGLTGKMKGKYGNAVFRIRRGQQVMAQYNPVVDNPNTDKQVNARSRFKLMAQLAAAYAPIIAILRDGAVTPRNQFVQKNFNLSASANGKAQIDLPLVQLTKSNREMPAFTVSRSSGDGISVSLIQAAALSRVVYAVVAKNSNEKLRVFATTVVENQTPDTPNTFAAKMPYTAEAIVVYAYGIIDTNNRASAAFGNLIAPTAEQVAQLIASRSINASDYATTATAGAYLEVGTTDAVSVAASDTPAGAIPTRPTIGGYSPFSEFTEVVMSAQEGADIYFTDDGTTPTVENGHLYERPIEISQTTTFKAIAVVDGVSSEVSTRTFTQTSAPVVVLAPTISGTNPFTQSTQVTITAESGAVIYYTTDGTDPDRNSTRYTGAFTLTATTTVKAVADLQDTLSAVSSVTFTKGGGDDPFAG